ncbi:hypothetical protein RBXJA2T_10309 [Rubrivivax benzoatilyticus JA2 = ATCC BAA-35]|nr:hypothetical protein RBXJA2T_10309 [Rubrivivax benzoatilyticus JA2 = ATCC BAA-35]
MADRDARLACFEAGARELKGEEERKRTAEAERKTKEFGLPSPVVRETLSSVKVRIVSEFDGWRPGATFKLDNGQVWEFIGNDSGTVTLTNNEAVIERGMLGSFFLRMEGVRSTPKVRRIR